MTFYTFDAEMWNVSFIFELVVTLRVDPPVWVVMLGQNRAHSLDAETVHTPRTKTPP